MKQTRYSWIGIMVLLAVSLLSSCAGTMDRIEYNLSHIDVGTVDVRSVPDGEYIGRHRVFPVSVKVNVIVVDGRIDRIDILRHFNGRGEAGEGVVERVLQAQSLEVDAISGATYSSRVILKAIESALSVTQFVYGSGNSSLPDKELPSR